MGQAFGCLQVHQSDVAIKEHFGKYDDVLEPGCHCLPWCFGYQVAGKLSLRLQQLDIRCETKTKDDVFVTVVASVQYCALKEKASDAFYKLSNTKAQIQAYVFDVIRTKVPKLELDSVFEQKNEIAWHAESKRQSGLGIARQCQAIMDGLRDSVLAFCANAPGTTAKDVMDMVLATLYIDKMEIGASSKSSACSSRMDLVQ